MTTKFPKRVWSPEQQEILNLNRKIEIERQKRIQNYQRTVSEDDIKLTKIFFWDHFLDKEPVALKDIEFGNIYMYLPGSGTTGIVRALSDQEEFGINVEFIVNGEQDIVFPEETRKKLYKLPILSYEFK